MRIGVIGLGRFGRLWASLMLQKAEAVYVWNRSPCALPDGALLLDAEAYKRLDIIFLCTSISVTGDMAKMIAPLLAPHTIVADTCSVKIFPLQALKEHLPAGNPILGTHPMFGPDSAREGVKGLPMVLCPERIDTERMQSVIDFLSLFEMNLLQMTADEHDREAAYTQGVTHFVGRVLSDMGLAPSEIATLGYTRLLQVMEQTCNDPWSLFMDLQQQNPYTADMRARLQASLDKYLNILNGVELG
ncbi:MAG: prephenate dehydrogenase/arogenate dehydrogenase family protein [Spirochaetaceae bacterium]|nr:MAG: prephenate dehydrogenase/arogenate dehydrogenase family protein [Spirochaetaceae bacterium]